MMHGWESFEPHREEYHSSWLETIGKPLELATRVVIMAGDWFVTVLREIEKKID